MIRSFARTFHQRHRFDDLELDRWRAETSEATETDRFDLRHRERLFFWWAFAKGVVRFPMTVARSATNIWAFIADLERLHGAPRRAMRTGRGCVLDRATWLVNGSRIELGDYVKVSAFSALIAGFDARISIGNYTILGPGVFVVAANHGVAANGVPIRYQPWSERAVVIGDDVWIGANAVILPGTTIGSGAVIGAGTVVSGEVPAGAIVHQRRGSLVVRPRQ
ncbi:acyltransferase [Mycolicibacterium sp. 22603]|uniref:acyltransferase n=1 Tax=Mycolicibacterium sp. 22603 TaxID=3453950 RepID=UPI003F82BE89